MSGLLLRYLPFAAGAVLLAVMVHILTVLAMPAVAMRTSGQLLQARAGDAAPQVVPPPAPGGELSPFADPAMVTGVCGFDLADGPFRIRAQMGDWFSSLVVLSPKGAVVHGLSDKAATRRLLDVVLATEQQIRALEAQDPDDRPPQEIRLRMPIARGVAVLRSLAPRASDVASVTETLRRAQCAVLAEQ
ncbi:MAG: DUF1254 domain-containing protein [Beijerinckiaceae bacterium]